MVDGCHTAGLSLFGQHVGMLPCDSLHFWSLLKTSLSCILFHLNHTLVWHCAAVALFTEIKTKVIKWSLMQQCCITRFSPNVCNNPSWAVPIKQGHSLTLKMFKVFVFTCGCFQFNLLLGCDLISQIHTPISILQSSFLIPNCLIRDIRETD